MKKMKLFAGVIVFGSIWGFAECIIGPRLSESGFPSGVIMTSIFAIGFMSISRMFYRQRGMQLGMGVIAGVLRLFNPFGGCVICSGIAILAEGFLFEIIWYKMDVVSKEFQNSTIKVSMGVISSYICYVGGYLTTQIFTPLISTSGFYLENIIGFMPQIFSEGLLAGIIGSITVPLIFILKNMDIENIRDKLYYPTVTFVTIFCWVFVIINWFLIFQV